MGCPYQGLGFDLLTKTSNAMPDHNMTYDDTTKNKLAGSRMPIAFAAESPGV
jgi:hypothetical protein